MGHANLYTDITNRTLAASLRAEDAAERTGASPFERKTCRLHRRWLHDCIASPLHVIPVAGYRWCDDCTTAAVVAVDELLRTVTVTCPNCGSQPRNAATRQIIRACTASLRIKLGGHWTSHARTA